MKKHQMVLVATMLAGLAGCGGRVGPDSSEIEKAFRATAPLEGRASPAIHDFKVRKCESVADDKVFTCEFSFMMMARTEIAKAKFSRSHECWVMTDFDSVASYNDSKK